MTIYLVTRHAGAEEWLRSTVGTSEVRVLAHLDSIEFKPGDKVCGILPLSWAARVCEQGGEAHVLTCEIPQSMRGRELNAEEMRAFGARLVRYDVREVPTPPTHAPIHWTSCTCFIAVKCPLSPDIPSVQPAGYRS